MCRIKLSKMKGKVIILALKVSDESLSVAEKKTAKAEYEKYKEEILNSGKLNTKRN